MADVKNYVLGRGEIYFAPFNTGTQTPGGERYLGNTTEFNLTIESDKLDHFSSDRGVRTKDDSALLELNRTGSLTTDNISEENAALFVLGDTQTVTQTSTPVTNENLGTLEADRYYQLGVSQSNPVGVRGVSAVTVTADPSGAATAAVLDTDYTLDADLGRIYVIAGGVLDGEEAEVDYTPTANSRTRVVTNASATVEGRLTFIAYNAKGKQKDVVIPYAILSPAGDWSLKGDDWQQLGFDLEVGELAGYAALYVDGRPAA